MPDLNKEIKSAHEIIEGLWLGNQAAANNLEFLKNIDVVVNASKHIPFAPGKRINIRVPINDPGPRDNPISQDQTDMLAALPGVVEKIWQYRKTGNTVLIHCHAGAQRSAAIMIAYLVKHGVWGNAQAVAQQVRSPVLLRLMKYNASLALLIKKRPVVFYGGASVNFLPALSKFLKLGVV